MALKRNLYPLGTSGPTHHFCYMPKHRRNEVLGSFRCGLQLACSRPHDAGAKPVATASSNSTLLSQFAFAFIAIPICKVGEPITSVEHLAVAHTQVAQQSFQRPVKDWYNVVSLFQAPERGPLQLACSFECSHRTGKSHHPCSCLTRLRGIS